MVVFRDEASMKEEDIFSVMEVELTKKPGKGLGLSIVGRKYGNGVFISDVVSFLKGVGLRHQLGMTPGTGRNVVGAWGHSRGRRPPHER
jgi:hypothetical protein